MKLFEKFLVLLICLVQVRESVCSHFRGATFTYRPVDPSDAANLKHRTQYVKLGDVESSKLPLLFGIPQGSTLGPLLFLLYENDLPNCCEGQSFVLSITE